MLIRYAKEDKSFFVRKYLLIVHSPGSTLFTNFRFLFSFIFSNRQLTSSRGSYLVNLDFFFHLKEKSMKQPRTESVCFPPIGGVRFAKHTWVYFSSQLTTICAKRWRCDAALDISARVYLPSPRPFFRRMRGDPCIKPFFLLAMAPETIISFNHLAATDSLEIITRTTPSKHAVCCEYYIFTNACENLLALISICTNHFYIFVCLVHII